MRAIMLTPKQVKHIRATMEITQEEMARRCRVTRRAVVKWEAAGVEGLGESVLRLEYLLFQIREATALIV